MDPVQNQIGTDKIERLVVSASPHIKGDESIATIMWNVVLALLPLTLHAVWNYGLPAITNITVSVLSALAAEYWIQKWQKKKVTIGDGSAVLTGLLLALCLPPNLPWFMTMIGSFFAISIAKQIFGGLGNNVFNPALVGRAFIMACFPAAMTTWGMSALVGGHQTWNLGILQLPVLQNFLHLDAVTSATPLELLKHQGYQHMVGTFGTQMDMYKTMFFGNKIATGLGETSAFLTIIGGIYLIIRGYIKWQVPVVMVATVGLWTWIFGGKAGFFTGDPVFHTMAGGLLLGAFFMATDMVTTPVSTKGKIVFAFGCGSITVLIRLIGGYPEGVCYSILLMNAVTPLLDRAFVPKKFGTIPQIRKGKKHVEGQ